MENFCGGTLKEMAISSMMIQLNYKKTAALIIIIIMLAISYYSDKAIYHVKKELKKFYEELDKSGKRDLNCTYRVELCWLRNIIQHEDFYNLDLTGDSFDFTALYKYKLLSVLKDQRFHGPTTYSHLSHLDERIWMKEIQLQLETEYEKRGIKKIKAIGTNETDFQGRRCDFNWTKFYKYIPRLRYHLDRYVHIYLQEEIVSYEPRHLPPNSLYGLISTPNTKNVCLYVQYLHKKGIHHLKCPVYEKDFHILINATYLDVSTHDIVCGFDIRMTLHEFFSNDLEPNDMRHLEEDVANMRSIIQNAKICKHITPKKSSKRYPELWLKVKDQWHWFAKNCYFPYDLDKQQYECVQNTSVVMIGDSHMKGIYRAIKVYGFQSLENQQAHMAMHLVTRLQNWIKTYEKNKQQIDRLLLSTGHHDLYFVNPILYMAYMHEVFNLIDMIGKMKPSPKVLWVEATPTERLTRTCAMLNNRMLKALKDWTVHELKKREVGIVPAYDIARAMPGFTRDGLHHKYATKRRIVREGHIGGAIVSVLIGMMCQ